jgi:hypothetical protein
MTANDLFEPILTDTAQCMEGDQVGEADIRVSPLISSLCRHRKGLSDQ